MFFDGGIRGFFDDLYYGAVEKGYKATHPRCWESVLKRQAVSCDKDDSECENIMEVLQSIGVKDEELFSLIEDAKDMEDMSEEEVKTLLGKLREKKITVDFGKVAEMLENERKKEQMQKPDDLKKIVEIVSKRWNPYDIFPEEKKYCTFDEVIEIIQSISHMKEKADSSEE